MRYQPRSASVLRRLSDSMCSTAAMAQLRGAIECVDVLTGELHRPEQVEALIEQAANTLDTLDVRECPKLAKYLRNRARVWHWPKRVCCPSSKHWENIIRSRR